MKGLRRFLAVLTAVLVASLLLEGGPASAAKPSSQAAGRFTCRASVVRVAGEGLLNGLLVEPIVANRAEDPCASSTAGVLNSEHSIVNVPNVLTVDLKLLYADTVLQKHGAMSEAGVALLDVGVLGHTIEVEVLTAEAAAECRSGSPHLSSESVVVGLRVDDVDVDVPTGQAHFEQVIPLVGTLHLNETIPGTNKVTQRALWLDTTLVGDVIVAEAVADVHDNPCGREPRPPRRIRGWMTGGGSIFRADGERVTHGMRLECAPADGPNNLQVNWPGNGWHLESVASSSCSDDPAIDQGRPLANFDTITGSGTGRCRGGGTATATWTATDAGEPGTNDTLQIAISGDCNLGQTTGKLDRGNHQAHGRV